jgi:cellulose biosynthesis protein BcsQ
VTTISLLSMKGGVGKTTITLGLASAGWHRGDRVLVVDLDTQLNATMGLGTPIRRGVVMPTPWGSQVDVLALGPSPDQPAEISPTAGNSLRTSLTTLVGDYDTVVIDCPPALSGWTAQAVSVCDRALIVTEPGFFTLRGARRPLEAVSAIRRTANPRMGNPCIVLNRVRSTVAEHGLRGSELEAVFGPLVSEVVIPERFAIQQAQESGVPIHAWDSPSGRELSTIYDRLYEQASVKERPIDIPAESRGAKP